MNTKHQENPTSDLSRFGYRELAIAGRLLTIFAGEDKNITCEGDIDLGDGVTIMMNTNSGNVFLTDEDFKVAMLNCNDKLEMFLTCLNCGAEGFASEDINLTGINEEGFGQCCECQKEEEREALICTHTGCKELQDENGEFCPKHYPV